MTTPYGRFDTIHQRSGIFMPRGTMVIVVLAAVNRDPDLFAAHDELDMTRPQNKHLGFGYSVHSCVGAPLARLEARIAFTTLLQRLATLKLAVAPENCNTQIVLSCAACESCPWRGNDSGKSYAVGRRFDKFCIFIWRNTREKLSNLFRNA